MWVGAMLDAGASFEPLVEVVASLRLPGVAIRSEPVLRASLRGVKFHVDVGGERAPGAFTMLRPQSHQGAKLPSASDHVHRGLADIRRIVEGAAMPDAVRARCVSVYRRIAEVEAAAWRECSMCCREAFETRFFLCASSCSKLLCKAYSRESRNG